MRIKPSELGQAKLFARPPDSMTLLAPLEVAILEHQPANLTELMLALQTPRPEILRALLFLRRRKLVEQLHEYATQRRSEAVWTRTELGGRVLRHHHSRARERSPQCPIKAA